MKTKNLNGLIAATYTPIGNDNHVRVEQIAPMVEYLLTNGVKGLYVCGSTGEGMSLTTEERRTVAQAYVNATAGRVPVIVQVGHNSLEESRQLASHAYSIGADGISATCPSYFKITSVESLVTSMSEVASGAPPLPFYYYHIPILTGSSLDMVEFLEMASGRIPNLVGLKFTDSKLHEFQRCLEFDQGRFDVIWGLDEMLLGALTTGAKTAIGSTYNIVAPLYLAIMEAFEEGDLVEARRLQSIAITIIKTIGQYPFHPAMKQVLRMLDLDFGDCRSPQPVIPDHAVKTLREQLDIIGFFDWNAPSSTTSPVDAR